MQIPIENQRVKEIIKHFCNGNELLFSKNIGISQPRVNRLFSLDPRSKKYPMVSFEIIQSIINKFIDIDAEWLVTGNGEMLKEKSQSKSQNQDYRDKYIEILEENRELLKENKRLKELIGTDENIVFQKPRTYAVAEDDPKRLVRPKEKLKKSKD